MNINTTAISLAIPSFNNSLTPKNQQITDQLVDAAGEGNAGQVIYIVTTHGLSILSTPHSKTGNTALHVAIQNGRVKVVGAITCLLVQLRSVDTVNLRTLLGLKNKENRSPLTTGGLTPRIKTELLAGLSDLWPFCSSHKGYSTSTFLKECGCRVCEPCMKSVEKGANCAACSQYLNPDGDVTLDRKNILQTLQDIREYSVLFDENDLPSCFNCTRLAFPPLSPQLCGHIQCFNCLENCNQRKICTAQIDDFGHLCRQPVEHIRANKSASRQFIRLFSSQTQCPDLTLLVATSIVTTAINRANSSTGLVGAVQSISVDMIPAKARISVIDGMTVERCIHIPDQPDRYAVPSTDRIHIRYHPDSLEQDLKIEELEYRLEPSIDKVRNKLETALANARKQHETNPAEAGQHTRLNLFPGINDIDLQEETDPSLPHITCNMSDEVSGVSIASSIGGKNTMEDTHIAAQFTIKSGRENVPIKILGVFDGHKTDKVAKYAVQCIIHSLSQQLELYNANGLTECGIWNAIKIGFVNLNLGYSSQTKGGTTACVALIINKVLWVANLGDSRAILINRNGENIQLSEDAKAKDELYKRSIEKRGGTVKLSKRCHRVNDVLEPARALGNHELRGAVSARPKITSYSLADFSGCLVLVSDGVTGAMGAPNLEIGSLVRTMLEKMDDLTSVNIASRIVRKALKLQEGLKADNTTAIVALLEKGQLAGYSADEKFPDPGPSARSDGARHQKKPIAGRHRRKKRCLLCHK